MTHRPNSRCVLSADATCPVCVCVRVCVCVCVCVRAIHTCSIILCSYLKHVHRGKAVEHKSSRQLLGEGVMSDRLCYDRGRVLEMGKIKQIQIHIL